MTNPYEPAFPLPGNLRESLGLTKREYFAAQALRGAIDWHGIHERPEKTTAEGIAKDCVAVADALITELNKEPKNET